MPENTETITETTPENTPEPAQSSAPKSDSSTNLQSERESVEDDGGLVELGVVETPKRQTAMEMKHKGRNISGLRNVSKPPPSGEGGSTDPIPWTPVTEPNHRNYYTGHENVQQRPVAGLTYWRSLTKAQQERLEVFVYREWPVLKPVPEGSKEYAYIDKLLGTEPLKDETDLFDRYGSGDYKVFINQTLPRNVAKDMKQAEKRTLAILHVRGMRDMKSRPPSDKRVSDIDQVALDDVANANYVAFLRTQGTLPDQTRGKELETEMASVEAIKEMANTNARMVDRVIDMAEKSGKREPVAQTSESNQLVMEAATRAMNIVEDAAKKTNAAEAGKQDPVEIAIRLIDLVNNKTPAPAPVAAAPVTVTVSPQETALLDEVKELRKQVAESTAARIESLERRLEDAAKTATAPAAASPLGGVKETISAFKEVKGLMDEIKGEGGGGDGDGGDMAGMPSWMRTIATVMPHVSTVVSSARDMLALWQMSQAGGQQMQQPQQRPQTQQQPQPQAQPQPQPQPQPVVVGTFPQPAGVIPMPPQGPTAQFETYGLLPEVAETLFLLRIPFLNHLEGAVTGVGDQQLNGGDFADWFAGGLGEDRYKRLRKFGGELFLQAIYAYPPISSRFEDMGATPDKVRQFVQEFMAFKLEDEVEGGGDGNGGGGGGGGDGVTDGGVGGAA